MGWLARRRRERGYEAALWDDELRELRREGRELERRVMASINRQHAASDARVVRVLTTAGWEDVKPGTFKSYSLPGDNYEERSASWVPAGAGDIAVHRSVQHCVLGVERLAAADES